MAGRLMVAVVWIVLEIPLLQAAESPCAGWFGVFPSFPGYQRRFKQPVVKKEKNPREYSQSVEYEWTGGALRTVTLTLRRDPRLATTIKNLQPRKPSPRTIKVGDRKAYGIEERERRLLLLPLTADRSVQLEGREDASLDDLTTLARKLDLTTIEKALEQPPRTNFTRQLETFRAIPKGASWSEIEAWVGPSALDIGSGIHIMVFKLTDGSTVNIGTPDLKKIVYIKHIQNGKVTELGK